MGTSQAASPGDVVKEPAGQAHQLLGDGQDVVHGNVRARAELGVELDIKRAVAVHSRDGRHRVALAAVRAADHTHHRVQIPKRQRGCIERLIRRSAAAPTPPATKGTVRSAESAATAALQSAWHAPRHTSNRVRFAP